MVWFYCDGCCDTIKKPKLVNHFRQCGGHSFTCVDCSRTFDRQSAQSHSTCVSEHDKYALGATKPGGYASQGFYHDGQQQQPAAAATDKGEQEILGMQFLSERPPWRCSCCNVNCTSRDTLLGHATGVKHKRRARAALGLTGQQQQQQNGSAAAANEQQPEQASSDAADNQKSEKEQQQQQPEQKSEQEDAEEQPASKKQKKQKKDKKDKAEKKNREQKTEQEDEAQGKQAVQQPAAAEQQQDKHKAKKQKKEKKAKEQEQQQQPDAAVVEPLLKVAKKKLKKKGKLGLKKLEALLKENANGSFSAEVVEAVKQQLLACAEVKLEDSKLHWNASS